MVFWAKVGDQMLIVSGKPFNHKDLWKSGSIESIIIKRMQADKINYSYQTLADLLYELKFRKHLINSALEMSKGKAKFNTFSKTRGNPQYWEISMDGGLLLKRGVKPSNGIRDIFINSPLYTFECSTATVILLYDALLKMIGETRFNLYFQNLYLYGWHLGSNYWISTFYGKHLLPGDIVYFNNPDHHPRTPWWRGVNAVDLGDGTYFGHGFGVWTAEEMIKILNRKRRPGSEISAYLTDLITRPIFKDWQKISR
jgi:protein-glutamine gamma-glutamyltransferase